MLSFLVILLVTKDTNSLIWSLILFSSQGMLCFMSQFFLFKTSSNVQPNMDIFVDTMFHIPFLGTSHPPIFGSCDPTYSLTPTSSFSHPLGSQNVHLIFRTIIVTQSLVSLVLLCILHPIICLKSLITTSYLLLIGILCANFLLMLSLLPSLELFLF